jgi:hypothetical protein
LGGSGRKPSTERLAVELIPGGREEVPRRGPLGSVQEAELRGSREAVDRLLGEDSLRRLGSAYWRYLGRISLGLLRVCSGPDHRLLSLRLPPAALLRFAAPRYRCGPDWAEVGWGIEGGLLVAREGRGRGSLRIRLQRPGGAEQGEGGRLLIRMAVDDYYPRLRGRGRLARAGAWLYARTQAGIHRLAMRGFLRSLARAEPCAAGAEPRGGRP